MKDHDSNAGDPLDPADPVNRDSVSDSWGRAAAYDAYADGLHTYALGGLRNHEAAASVVYCAYIAADHHVAHLGDAEMLRPWLYAIARHYCRAGNLPRMRLAPSAAGRSQVSRPPGTSAKDAAKDAAKDRALADLERSLLTAELASLDWPDTDGLTAAHREVLELSVRHGMESRAVGLILGKPAAESFELLSAAWHELERSLAATALLRTTREHCPDLATLAAGWNGRLTAQRREPLVAHVDACSRCQFHLHKVVGAPQAPSILPHVSAPKELRERVLGDLLDTTPDRAAEKAAIAGRLTRFDALGFPTADAMVPPRVRPVRVPVGVGASATSVADGAPDKKPRLLAALLTGPTAEHRRRGRLGRRPAAGEAVDGPIAPRLGLAAAAGSGSEVPRRGGVAAGNADADPSRERFGAGAGMEPVVLAAVGGPAARTDGAAPSSSRTGAVEAGVEDAAPSKLPRHRDSATAVMAALADDGDLAAPTSSAAPSRLRRREDSATAVMAASADDGGFVARTNGAAPSSSRRGAVEVGVEDAAPSRLPRREDAVTTVMAAVRDDGLGSGSGSVFEDLHGDRRAPAQPRRPRRNSVGAAIEGRRRGVADVNSGAVEPRRVNDSYEAAAAVAAALAAEDPAAHRVPRISPAGGGRKPDAARRAPVSAGTGARTFTRPAPAPVRRRKSTFRSALASSAVLSGVGAAGVTAFVLFVPSSANGNKTLFTPPDPNGASAQVPGYPRPTDGSGTGPAMPVAGGRMGGGPLPGGDTVTAQVVAAVVPAASEPGSGSASGPGGPGRPTAPPVGGPMDSLPPQTAPTSPGQQPSNPGTGQLNISVTQRSNTPGEVTVTLWNSGTAPVEWTASPDAPWITLSAVSGIIAPGAQTTMRIVVDRGAEPATPWQAHVRFDPGGQMIALSGAGNPGTPSSSRPPTPPSSTPSTPGSSTPTSGPSTTPSSPPSTPPSSPPSTPHSPPSSSPSTSPSSSGGPGGPGTSGSSAGSPSGSPSTTPSGTGSPSASPSPSTPSGTGPSGSRTSSGASPNPSSRPYSPRHR